MLPKSGSVVSLDPAKSPFCVKDDGSHNYPPITNAGVLKAGGDNATAWWWTKNGCGKNGELPCVCGHLYSDPSSSAHGTIGRRCATKGCKCDHYFAKHWDLKDPKVLMCIEPGYKFPEAPATPRFFVNPDGSHNYPRLLRHREGSSKDIFSGDWTRDMADMPCVCGHKGWLAGHGSPRPKRESKTDKCEVTGCMCPHYWAREWTVESKIAEDGSVKRYPISEWFAEPLEKGS